ncbi:WD40 repeat-like protein [Anaeromyces robustus]|uniref:WD40 repeat-like protein n=1 Tax=Anaeromyces robustus TaxID=1754192 RepID=A0A1Y1WU30_9FUNG|nr:WD40 repeat-like protein [Anaeromyces robustus]|eukprot:ORX77047.1 WD40 repeat-like protein [Anaeromyces robustus]
MILNIKYYEQKFSVTERVNNDDSDYYDEIRRSRSLTRKPIGNRPQSVDYSESENPKIKIRYSVRGVPIDNTTKKHHHYHERDNTSPSVKTSLSIKKNSRSLSLSVRKEPVETEGTRSLSQSHSHSHSHTHSEKYPLTEHHKKEKRSNEINKEKSKSSKNHHHSHSRDIEDGNRRKKTITSSERHYDEDNSIINYSKKKKKHNKERNKHHNVENDDISSLSKLSKKSKSNNHDSIRSSSRHTSKKSDIIYDDEDKENIKPNKKKNKNILSKINEDDSLSLSSFSINQRHREKRLRDKIRNRSSSKDTSHRSHHKNEVKEKEGNQMNSEETIIPKNSSRISSNSTIVPSNPTPMSPLKSSKPSPLEGGGGRLYDLVSKLSKTPYSTQNNGRSLSRSRSVSISNHISGHSNDNDENVNQPSIRNINNNYKKNNRVPYSSYHELPLYKSNESLIELRENVLHKYESSEMLPPAKAQKEKYKNSIKRSLSSDTSKLRYPINNNNNNNTDKTDIEESKKSRSQSLSNSEKHKKRKNKEDKEENKENKNDDIEKENKDKDKKKHRHKHRSMSRDPESISTSKKYKDNDKEKVIEKKIKRHANVPAPIPDVSLKKEQIPKRENINKKEGEEEKEEKEEEEEDLAIKPVKPVIEKPLQNLNNKDVTTFYPEGYAPSFDDSVKTKINEEDDIEDKNSKSKRSRSKTHSHSRSRSHRHHHHHKSKSKSRSRSKSKNRNNSIDDTQDDLTKDDKKHSRRHKSTNDEASTIVEKLEEYPYEKNIFENLKKKPEDFKNSNICVHIYRTDALELNIKNVHPLVKVHIVDINTEKYLEKSSVLRPATTFYENSEMEYIMPILTQPYHLQRNHTNIPRWNQGLYINEDYLHVVRKNVIIFFEIIDFVERAADRKNRDRDGWHRIAWAFLKLVGTHELVNTEHTRRLQLYKYPKKLIKNNDPQRPEIIDYWKRKLVKYQSTLFVKVYSQKIPETKEVSYRPKMPNEKEVGAWTYNQLMSTYFSKKKILDPVYKSFINFSQKPSWRREDGQLCKIPNHLHFRIDGGERGCLAAEYSHLGYLFAIASTSLNSVTTIKIFDTVSGDKIASLSGHQDLVYDLKWSRDDKHLFSASADGSVRAWSIQSETSIRPSTIFQHPSYVYCIQIHPIIGKDNKITVITGSYDGKIRFWKYDHNLYNNIDFSKQVNNQTQFLPAYVLTGHESTINSLAIETSGIRLFSADGKGYIRVWSCRSDPINCIRLHPNERQLLVHCLGNTLYMMDIRIFKVLTCITNLPSNQYPIKSILSPCGTYIFSGSSDGKVYVYNSMTGNLVAKYENLTISQPILGIAYHPLDDYISFYTYGPEQPILTYVWDSNYKPLESMLKVSDTEDSKINKMFDLTATKVFDDDKKFPYSSFNNLDKKSVDDDMDLPVGLRNKQGFRYIDETLKAKNVYI